MFLTRPSESQSVRNGKSIYNGNLRGTVTLPPIAERLAIELSPPVFTTYICCGWDSNNKSSAGGANAFTPAPSPRSLSVLSTN